MYTIEGTGREFETRGEAEDWGRENMCAVYDIVKVEDTAGMTIGEIYDLLPMTERTLLKRYKSYPFKIANNHGHPCHWYIYDEKGERPIGVVIYYAGRKLSLSGITYRD